MQTWRGAKDRFIRLGYKQICIMSDQERDALRQEWRDGIKDNADSTRTYELLRQYDRECRQKTIHERKIREQQSNNAVETAGLCTQ
jgi:hypothetical protein